MFKRILTLCLCLVLLVGVCPRQTLAASVYEGIQGPTLVKTDGTWYYVKDGKVADHVTGLVKYNGQWFYVKEGKLASDTTTLVKYNGSWWYVVKGQLASNTTTLVKYNGQWWYVVKGKVASATTGLVKYNNEWWYVVKGKVASQTTTLVKYNNEWWYVVKGKLAAKTTTLVKFSGSWWYVLNGKVASKTTTLVPYAGKWYYVKNGTTQPNATTLVKYQGLWYYVQNGVMSNATTLCAFNGQRYYVRDGIAMTGYTGFPTVGGRQYYVRKGAVVCDIAGHGIWKALPTQYRCGSREYYGTDLRLNSDGSFTGTFAQEVYEVYDEDHYDSTVYICNFHGQFSTPKKVSQYIYQVKVTSLTVDAKPGQVYYDDYGRKCVTTSDHEEIRTGDVLLICLPGLPLDEAPGALDWYFSGSEDVVFVPDGYASLYNQRVQADFFGIADWAEAY